MMAQKKSSIWFYCSQAIDITIFAQNVDSDVSLLFLYMTRSRQLAHDQGEVLPKNSPLLLCNAFLQALSRNQVIYRFFQVHNDEHLTEACEV